MEQLQHLAIIMDGNRRWAKGKGLPAFEGHRQGYQKAKQVGDWCLDRGIKILTVFAFSTENWQRSKKEVDTLMKLLEFALTKDLKIYIKKGIKIKVLGKIKDFSQRLQKAIAEAEEKTKNGEKGVLNLCLNYGGRLEIVEAVKKICKEKISPNKITEKTISDHLWTKSEPDPELVIRTSGEMRLSGFLTWQSVYSELYFCKKNWPDFSEKDLDEALGEYWRRRRRFGK
ncbi:MAG: polyprenyl diphosphate synthase [Patescibacteria group bacterium]